jgi:acetyl-CoA carboxylase alpha subunit
MSKLVYQTIDSMAKGFIELSGDRVQYEDKKLISGIAWIYGARSMIIAVSPEETANVESALRKGQRMVALAERMKCRVLLLLGIGGKETSWPAPKQDLTHGLNELIGFLTAPPVQVVAVEVGEMTDIERLLAGAADNWVALEDLAEMS